MAEVELVINATPQQVYEVLADGWTYSDWVVGSAHIRAVDPGWPAAGTAIHHKVGPWPVSIKDRTHAVVSDPPHRLVLRARAWPMGEATVDMVLQDAGSGRTLVKMLEDAEAGPMQWVQNKLNDLLLHHRNNESLHRLADLAERRAAPGNSGDTSRTDAT
jgi:uncharacterized protein YndB with AHSA1/START domain